MTNKPTIKTIAEMAGVSHVAVSKALRGHPDISKETTARIQKIADEVGYIPNAAARNLSSNSSTTIGMIVPSMEENTSYNPVFNTISYVAAQKGYCVMLGSSHRSKELEEHHCKMMIGNRVGAIIIAPCSSENEHIEKICSDRVPLIYIGGKCTSNTEFSVHCNYRFSAELVVNHFYQLGHRNIALFTYEPENLTILQKEDGFRTAMQQRQLQPIIYRFGQSSDTVRAGHELTKRLIAHHSLPTAIWCASDLMAIGVHSCLREHGYRIPEDISLIGHDNLYFCQLPDIKLTTLAIPTELMAESAVNLAVGLINQHVNLHKNQTFQTQLVLRSSTGPVPNIQ